MLEKRAQDASPPHQQRSPPPEFKSRSLPVVSLLYTFMVTAGFSVAFRNKLLVRLKRVCFTHSSPLSSCPLMSLFVVWTEPQREPRGEPQVEPRRFVLNWINIVIF